MSKELITAWIFIGIGWTLYFLTALELFINEVQIWLYLCQILCWNISAIALFAGTIKLKKDSQGLEDIKANSWKIGAYQQRIEEAETKIINEEQIMEKLELENKITELEAQIVELKKELQKGTEADPTEYEFWKPSEEEDYYFIGNSFRLCNMCWDSDEIDVEHQQLGLIYKTAEQAEYEAKCIKYKHLYRRYIQEHTEPLDWEDEDQNMYYAMYRPNHNPCVQIDYDLPAYGKYTGTEYASSEQIIRDAIKFVDEDNFKKYVLEIEE